MLTVTRRIVATVAAVAVVLGGAAPSPASASTNVDCPAGPVLQSVRQGMSADITVGCLPATSFGTPVTHRFAVSPGSNTLVTANGTATMINSSSGVVRFTANADAVGTQRVIVEALDEGAGFDQVELQFEVTSNRPPTCAGTTLTTPHGIAILVTFAGTCTDPDGDPVVLELAASAGNGRLDRVGPTSFLYTPNSGFAGTDGFLIIGSDGTASSMPAPVTITVRNDPPTCTADPATTRSGRSIEVRLSCSDPQGDPVVITVAGAVTSGTPSIDAAARLRFSAARTFTGTATILLRATDALVATTFTASIRVLPALRATVTNLGIGPRGVRLRVACPKGSARTCVGRASAHVHHRRQRLQAGAMCRWSVPRGRTATVLCRFSRGEASALRRAHRQRVTARLEMSMVDDAGVTVRTTDTSVMQVAR